MHRSFEDFKSLKNHKTPGIDRLTAEITKVNLFVKSEEFVYLVNESLKIGTFSQVLKAMRVVPIYKSGKKSRRENFRTIYVLSVLGKILERVAIERLDNFRDKNKRF